MIKLQDEKFKQILEELENTNSITRVEFFNLGGADRFLIWWFFYYRDEFITLLADFHYEWIESLFSDKDVMIEGFRGSIKTTITSAVVTYKVIHGFNKFVVWQSFEDGASTRNTTQIAIKLLNPLLVKDYGKLLNLTGSKKEDLEKKSVGDFDLTSGAKILATSLGQKLRGAVSRSRRPDLLVLDDIDVTDSVKNPEIIQKNYDKITGETFGALSKEKSQIYFLGNTINKDGIVPRFNKEKSLDINWKVYKQPLFDGQDNIVWAFFTKEMVEKIKSKEGDRAFNQNYKLIPLDNYEDGLIKDYDLRYYDYLNLDDFDNLYMHCDTTHTGKTTSDYFCAMILGENKKDKNFYSIDFILEKLDVEQQARKTIVLYQKFAYKIKKLTYDEKANQGFGFWIKKLAKEEYNISLPIEELKYPNDKITHFEPHIPHFKANRVYLPSRHKDIQEATLQLTAFPLKGVNDDFVDGLSGVLDNYTIEQDILDKYF